MIRSALFVCCFILSSLVQTSLVQASDWPMQVSGVPSRIVDGDTIHLDGHKIRLLGIDTPEMRQFCQDSNGADWPCGIRARDMLAGMVGASTQVDCVISGRDRYKRLLGRCFAGSLDVQRALIAAGFGVAEYTPDYQDEEAKAKQLKLGMWAGTFERPRVYRKSH